MILIAFLIAYAFVGAALIGPEIVDYLRVSRTARDWLTCGLCLITMMIAWPLIVWATRKP